MRRVIPGLLLLSCVGCDQGQLALILEMRTSPVDEAAAFLVDGDPVTRESDGAYRWERTFDDFEAAEEYAEATGFVLQCHVDFVSCGQFVVQTLNCDAEMETRLGRLVAERDSFYFFPNGGLPYCGEGECVGESDSTLLIP